MKRTTSNALAIALALGTMLLTAASARAQETARSDDAEARSLEENVEDFLKELRFGNVRDGLTSLLKNSPLTTQKEALVAIEQKLSDIPSQYGEVRDFERISVSRIGKQHVVLLRYLINCEAYPLAFQVVYYRAFKRGETPRAGEDWVVVSLRCDANVELLAPEK